MNWNFSYKDGHLIRDEDGKVMGNKDRDGYMCFTKGNRSFKVHRVIYELHHGSIAKGLQVHHINSNKQDNRIENLALVTPQQNCTKTDRLGNGYYLHKQSNKYHAYRVFKGKKYSSGYWVTKCGAYLASKMIFVNLKHQF